MKQIFKERLEELERQHPQAMVLLLDGEGNYLYANEHCRDVLGYEPSEVIGRHALDFAAPEDIPHVKLTLQDALLNYESVTVGIQIAAKTGEYVRVQGAAYRLDDPETTEIYLIGWVARA